jgi:hypothetical protein
MIAKKARGDWRWRAFGRRGILGNLILQGVRLLEVTATMETPPKDYWVLVLHLLRVLAMLNHHQ